MSVSFGSAASSRDGERISHARERLKSNAGQPLTGEIGFPGPRLLSLRLLVGIPGISFVDAGVERNRANANSPRQRRALQRQRPASRLRASPPTVLLLPLLLPFPPLPCPPPPSHLPSRPSLPPSRGSIPSRRLARPLLHLPPSAPAWLLLPSHSTSTWPAEAAPSSTRAHRRARPGVSAGGGRGRWSGRLHVRGARLLLRLQRRRGR